MHAGNALFAAILEVIYRLLDLYIWVLIVNAILSWLVAFDVINRHNRVVQVIGDFTYRITEPALRPIRRFLPSMGGMDLSPLALMAIIWVIQLFIRNIWGQL